MIFYVYKQKLRYIKLHYILRDKYGIQCKDYCYTRITLSPMFIHDKQTCALVAKEIIPYYNKIIYLIYQVIMTFKSLNYGGKEIENKAVNHIYELYN